MAKKQTPLEKIKKKMDKLSAIHEKEEAIFEEINDILDEAEEDDFYISEDWANDPIAKRNK